MTALTKISGILHLSKYTNKYVGMWVVLHVFWKWRRGHRALAFAAKQDLDPVVLVNQLQSGCVLISLHLRLCSWVLIF